MPWTTDADVEKHKKGLSKKGMAQWRRIANSVRKKEITKGKSEKEADASAIKQANGVVLNTNESKGVYSSYLIQKQPLEYDVKLTTHQEKAHLVVPVTMMVEGVHNGSQGPLLHEITELGKFPESWNGIPVVIYHPQRDGSPVSANSPDIIDKELVGRVYNTNVDDNKLKAEVWLDEDRLNSISENTLEAVNDLKEVEISLGMFTENEMENGEYEGEEYIGVAHNHRPDHLAILPDQIGACSLKDGCGLGANKKQEDMEIKMLIQGEKLLQTLLNFNKEGYKLSEIENNVEVDYRKKLDLVYSALNELDEHIYHYLEEMYDNYIIYSKREKEETKMYKQTYKIESGKVEFVGEPIEVHKKVEYIVNSRLTRTKFSNNNKKEDTNMADKVECTPCVKKKVDELIANSQGRYTEDNRAELELLSEAVLDIIAKPVEVIKEVEKKVNVLSEEDQAALTAYRKQLKEKRDKMIQSIQANTSKETWPDEVLNEMKDDVLERLHNSVRKEDEVDYSVNAARTIQANAVKEEPLYLTGQFETNKKEE